MAIELIQVLVHLASLEGNTRVGIHRHLIVEFHVDVLLLGDVTLSVVDPLVKSPNFDFIVKLVELRLQLRVNMRSTLLLLLPHDRVGSC